MQYVDLIGVSPKRKWEIVTPPVFLESYWKYACTYLSVWSPMILIEFLLAPTVPSPPRPQNLQDTQVLSAVAGTSVGSGNERLVTSSSIPTVKLAFGGSKPKLLGIR